MMGQIKISLKEYELLDGSTRSLVQHVGDGSIIKRFDKTPLPVRSENVVCPHFLELKWAYGCPFDCAWCYLKGTFRFLPTGTKPVVKNYDKVESHLRRFLSELTTPEILNTGEIADSLMSEGSSQPFSKFVIPILESQSRHKVLFVTKSNNIRYLLEINPHNQVIMSFSFNADEVARRWERDAPPVQSTINGSTDKSWLEYLKESSNWGKKVDFKTRYEIYAAMIKKLKDVYGYEGIALCKETVAMWAKLGMDYRKIKCNCIW